MDIFTLNHPIIGLKIALIGTGKIGKEVLKTILSSQKDFPELKEFIAITRHPKRLRGFMMDFDSAFRSTIYRQRNTPILLKISDSYTEIDKAHIVIIAAGVWPDEDLKKQFRRIDPDERLVQTVDNSPMIKELCAHIKSYSPHAAVFVITNQVDLITEIIRLELPNQTIIGIGGLLDSRRFQLILAEILYQQKELPDPDPERITAHIVGFHNKNMFLLTDSLHINGKKVDSLKEPLATYVKQALERTRTFGIEVSQLQRDEKHPDVDTGSSILPSQIIADVIRAFTNLDFSLSGTFNVKLPDTLAKIYGFLTNGFAASIPVIIKKSGISLNNTYAISQEEKNLFQMAAEQLKQDMQLVLNMSALRDTSVN